MSKAVSFYENCTRIVIRAIDEFEVDEHEGSDIRFYCKFLTIPGAGPDGKSSQCSFPPRFLPLHTAGFTFTIDTYSESGTLGIEHRVRYTPDRNHSLSKKLGKFRNESDFLAHTAQSFFADLTHQMDVALGQP